MTERTPKTDRATRIFTTLLDDRDLRAGLTTPGPDTVMISQVSDLIAGLDIGETTSFVKLLVHEIAKPEAAAANGVRVDTGKKVAALVLLRQTPLGKVFRLNLFDIYDDALGTIQPDSKNNSSATRDRVLPLLEAGEIIAPYLHNSPAVSMHRFTSTIGIHTRRITSLLNEEDAIEINSRSNDLIEAIATGQVKPRPTTAILEETKIIPKDVQKPAEEVFLASEKSSADPEPVADFQTEQPAITLAVIPQVIPQEEQNIPEDAVGQSVEGVTEAVPQVNLLAQVINERLSTPDQVTNYWRAKLKADGARAGMDIVVPDCDWTEEEIRRPMVDMEGREVPGMMVYKPFGVGLGHLGKMYPEMAYSSLDAPVTESDWSTGWVKVEALIDAPNLSSDQRQLEHFARRSGYRGQRLSTYILASQASKELAGEFFDEHTWARLLGTRGWGKFPLYVNCSWDGVGFSAEWRMLREDRFPYLGGRFEEVRRA